MNCRGDDDIDAKRSRPSIGNTRLWATRGKNACDWLGPDRRITSGPPATAAASRWGKPLRENSPHTWLHPNASQKSQICSCNAGTVHTWPVTAAPVIRHRVAYRGSYYRIGPLRALRFVMPSLTQLSRKLKPRGSPSTSP